MQLSLPLLSFILFFLPSWGAEPLLLPRPDGPYGVGTKAIELTDLNRPFLREKGPKRWMAQAFYPTLPHSETYPYMPGTLSEGKVQGISVITYAKPYAPLLSSQHFPFIIFIPGLGEERQKYTILCENLASHGYIVVSLDQPYVSNFTQFPDGKKIVLTLKDAWKVPSDRDYRYAYFDAAMQAVMEDIQYLLDNFSYFNTTYFNGALRSNDIILAGHSFGGNVAHTFGFNNPKIGRIMDIDSKITEKKIFGCLGPPSNVDVKPVLFIRGQLQYQEDVNDQLTSIHNATVWSPMVQHSAFSDQAYLAATLSGFKEPSFFNKLIRYLFKWGPHFSEVDTSLGEQDVHEWYTIYCQQITKWLKKTEKSDGR